MDTQSIDHRLSKRVHSDHPSHRLTTSRIKVRHSTTFRILAIVFTLTLGSAASAWFTLAQQLRLQASLELLTVVYVPFLDRLAEARTQEFLIRTHRRGREISDPMSEHSQIESDQLILALEERSHLVRETLRPLEEAIRFPERIGGIEQLESVFELIEPLKRLLQLAEEDESRQKFDNEASREEIARWNTINNLFRSLQAKGQEALIIHDTKVRATVRYTEQWTWVITATGAVLALLASAAIILTLRPLQRLTFHVHRLGLGDWSQPINVKTNPEQDNEVSRLAREFSQMATALIERERLLIRSERMAAIGKMAAQITHEIRNPLSSLALNAELLNDELAASHPEAISRLERIIAEVDRLALITQSYLAFARRSKPELNPIDLSAELADLLDFLAEEHSRLKIRVERDLGDHPVWIKGDSQQLRQAFLNLLRNAQEAALERKIVNDATPALAAPTATLSIQLSCKSGFVNVVVGDNGPGIAMPENQLEQIFEPFITAKSKGTGLGLPLVQQIVTDHGGSVRVLSTGSSGTHFEVRFPACDSPATSVSSETAH